MVKTLKLFNRQHKLGLVFNNYGTFKDTRVNLADESKRVLFKLFQSFGYHLPNIKIETQLFDSLIKPIFVYGSEVWGAFYRQL